MEKAIDIKRRAQRCIQNGDLDGALNEYEKLVGSEDSDPYNYVLLADLLYKKGDQGSASERYLSAVGAYEHASLYKNAIAVCKKMMRLSLSPAKVLQALGNLHALDGLSGEAALYYVQYAEHMVRSGSPAEAAQALRQAFDVCQDNLRVLEQLSEAWLLAGETDKAGEVLLEAASLYRQRGAEADARRCDERVTNLAPAKAPATAPAAVQASASAMPDDLTPFAMARVPVTDATSAPPASHPAESVAFERPHGESEPIARSEEFAPTLPLEVDRLHGFETGRHEAASPAEEATQPDPEPIADSESLVLEPAAMPEAAAAHPAADNRYEGAHDDLVLVDDDDEAEVEFEIEDEPAMYEEVAAEEHVVAGTADREAVYEIAADDIVSVEELPEGEEESSEDPVYEIAADELVSFDVPPAEERADDPVYEIIEDTLAEPGTTPQAPSLSFQSATVAGVPAPVPEDLALAEVEALLAAAQEQFRAGDRDQASNTLTHAAQAYESLDRLENAAAIYRSLGKGAHSTPEILELWLSNCERRHDTREAAAVACDLGDRTLNDGDENGARGWFERAMALDSENEIARRRLERLAPSNGRVKQPVALATSSAPPPEPAPAPAAPSLAPAPQDQRVEIAVGRAEAVSFDLAALLSEFQRGVDSQLAGDAQSHYDLGMTYREMGLHEQAMGSFRNAEQDPRFAVRASEMSARCLAEQGRHSEAAGEFQRALALPGISNENDIELRFHFGNSLVELGRLEEALPEYEQVVERMPDFEDVGVRLDSLRRTLGRA